jgi:signal peptidase I
MRDMMDLLDAPQLGLVAEVLASGGAIRLRVRGTSMLPTLWPGDVLAIEGTSCQASVAGDIVLVRRNFVHRVKGKHICNDHLWLITQGDAVAQVDPFVDDSQLLGKVLFIQRNRRVIVPRRQRSTAARLLAWVLCHCDRFRSICLRMHSFRQDFGQQAQKGYAHV